MVTLEKLNRTFFSTGPHNIDNAEPALVSVRGLLQILPQGLVEDLRRHHVRLGCLMEVLDRNDVLRDGWLLLQVRVQHTEQGLRGRELPIHICSPRL